MRHSRLLPTLVAVLAIAAPAAADAASEAAPPKCEMASCQDPLFTVDYPADQTFTTAAGVTVNLPVQFYDTDLYELTGTADLRVLRKMTAGTGFRPLRTESGKGVVTIAFTYYRDTNIEPYQEWFVEIPTNRRQITIPDDPYEMFGAVIDPDNVGYGVKLLIDKQLAIDVGREYYHLDKEPVPERMSVRHTSSAADIRGTTPDGRPIISAHIPIDGSPAAQAQSWQRMSGTAAFGRWGQSTAQHQGLAEFNYVYRDILDSAIKRVHLAGRITMDPANVRIGLPQRGTTFSVDPSTSDWGSKLSSMRFRPRFALHLPKGRYVLGLGFAPASEPGGGGSASAPPVTTVLSDLLGAAR